MVVDGTYGLSEREDITVYAARAARDPVLGGGLYFRCDIVQIRLCHFGLFR